MHLVDDLIANKGKNIIYAGRSLSEDTHIAVNVLNEALGNTILYNTNSESLSFSTLTSKDEWVKLTEKMEKGEIGVVINYDVNLVYLLPADYGFKEALRKVSTVVTLTEL